MRKTTPKPLSAKAPRYTGGRITMHNCNARYSAVHPLIVGETHIWHATPVVHRGVERLRGTRLPRTAPCPAGSARTQSARRVRAEVIATIAERTPGGRERRARGEHHRDEADRGQCPAQPTPPCVPAQAQLSPALRASASRAAAPAGPSTSAACATRTSTTLTATRKAMTITTAQSRRLRGTHENPAMSAPKVIGRVAVLLPGRPGRSPPPCLQGDAGQA
jgi:hypothetical protein